MNIIDLIGMKYPIKDLNGNVVSEKRIVSANHLSNVNGIVIFLEGNTDVGITISYAQLYEMSGVSSTNRGN